MSRCLSLLTSFLCCLPCILRYFVLHSFSGHWVAFLESPTTPHFLSEESRRQAVRLCGKQNVILGHVRLVEEFVAQEETKEEEEERKKRGVRSLSAREGFEHLTLSNPYQLPLFQTYWIVHAEIVAFKEPPSSVFTSKAAVEAIAASGGAAASAVLPRPAAANTDGDEELARSLSSSSLKGSSSSNSIGERVAAKNGNSRDKNNTNNAV